MDEPVQEQPPGDAPLEPVPASAPPLKGGAMRRPAAASVWPIVIGTLGIVFGAGGLIGYGCIGTGGTLVMATMAGTFRQMSETNPQFEVQAAQFEAMSEYIVPSIASNAVAGALGIVLLVGGIGVIGRRSGGPRTLVVWSVLKILYTVPAVWLGYRMGMAQFDAMQDAATTQTNPAIAGGMLSFMRHFGTAGAVLQLLWLWSWPLFLLIWFARRKIKSEVATWRTGAAGADAAGP